MGRLAFWVLIPALLHAQAAPLWPGARYTSADRDRALERGLEFIYRVASDPKVFAEWGHDLLWCLYTISDTAKDAKLRETARKMGRERAMEWRRIHAAVPAHIDADDLSDLVFGSDAADRLGARDPGFKQQIRKAARKFSAADFLLFDPVREPPPSAPDQSGYDVWTDALITTYTGDIYGVMLGAHYRDVLQWIRVMRPYPARESIGAKGFYKVTYAITHVVYTLNDYNRYLLSPAWLPEEFQYLKTNLEAAVRMQDPETVGEFLDTLRDFGMTEQDALIRTGVDYVLSKQNADGSWGDPADPDIYHRYHSTWTAVDGLREYAWKGQRLSFPELKPLLAAH